MPTALPRLPAFRPAPDALRGLIDDCARPDLCLRDIALYHDTSVEALSEYLVSADAHPALSNAYQASIIRARLAAAAFLSDAVHALTRILQSYAAESANDAPATTPRAAVFLERRRTSARRAAHLLLRIVNLAPLPLLAQSALRPEAGPPLDAGTDSAKVRINPAATAKPSEAPAISDVSPPDAGPASAKDRVNPAAITNPAAASAIADAAPEPTNVRSAPAAIPNSVPAPTPTAHHDPP